MDAGDLGLQDPDALPSPTVSRTFQTEALGRGRPPIGRMRRSSSAGKSFGRRSSTGKAMLRRTVPLPALVEPEVLARLRRWIVALAVVVFDLDEGPLLDNIMPSETGLDEAELASIAFLSMPDSTMTSFDGTRYTSFSWRLPRRRTDLPPLHAYVSFCQRKDPLVARGYVQRSLVVITHLDLPGLFTTLVDSLGPTQTRSPVDACLSIEVALRNVARWPPPYSDADEGTVLDLALLNSIVTVDVPSPGQPQAHDGRATSSPRIPRTAVLGACPLTPLSLLFKDRLESLWLLFELLVIADEPLVVYAANDASKASELVTWCTRLTLPIPFAGDWRPLFTVHVGDYAAIVDRKQPLRPGLILGVTSPLIFSMLAHYPHVILAGVDPLAHHSVRHHRAASFAAAPNGTADPGIVLTSTRKRVVRRDSDFVKSVEAVMRTGDYLAADALLIRHFADLAGKLLNPIDRYVTTALMPAASTNVLASPKPTLAFDQAAFFASLRQHSTPFQLRKTKSASSSHLIGFYERFVRGPNLRPWLAKRLAEADTAIRERYVHGLATADVDGWAKRNASARDMDELLSRLQTEVRISDEARRTLHARRRSRSFSEDLSTLRLVSKVEERSRQLRDQATRVDQLRHASQTYR